MIHVFIINPTIEDRQYGSILRSQLKAYTSISHFVFNITGPNSEEEIVERVLKYLDDEELRIYVVGGLGTLHNVINALDGHFDKVEIAWIPKGSENSFIYNFGKDAETFLDLHAQINGQAVPIDYIRTNHGIAINYISTGADRKFIQKKRASKGNTIFSSLIDLFLITLSVVTTPPFPVKISFGDSDYVDFQSIKELIFSNGSYLSKNFKVNDTALMNDGIGEYIYGIVPDTNILLRFLSNFVWKGKTAKTRIHNGTSKKIHAKFASPSPVSLDGIVTSEFSDWEARIVSGELRFVLPQGVNLHYK